MIFYISICYNFLKQNIIRPYNLTKCFLFTIMITNNRKKIIMNSELKNVSFKEHLAEMVAREIRSVLRANNINLPQEVIAYCLYCKKTNISPCLIDKNIDFNWHLLEDILRKNTAETFAQIILFCSENEGRSNESTPESLINLSSALLNIQNDDTVADMGCGKGNFILNTANQYRGKHYFGFDISKEDILIAKIKAEIAQQCNYIPAGTKISIERKDIFELQRELSTPNGKRYNKIFAHYPFNLKRTEVPWGDEIKNFISLVPSANWAFNYLIRTMLEKNGRGIAIMPSGSTVNGRERKIRQYFLERGYIEAIISLPFGMLNETFIPVSILILSDNENNKHGVYMYEVTSYQKGRRQNTLTEQDIRKITEEYRGHFVKMEDIKKHNYELGPGVYKNDIQFDTDTRPFGELTKSVIRAGALSAKELDDLRIEENTEETEKKYYYLNSADIRDGMITDNLPRLKDIPGKNRKFIIEDNSLIITKNAPYKIAYKDEQDKRSILANGNVYIVTLDNEKVNPYFVKAFLESKKGMELLESVSTGAFVYNISLDALREMPFPVLPLEKQNEIASAYLSYTQKIKEKNQELKELKGKLSSVCDDILRR